MADFRTLALAYLPPLDSSSDFAAGCRGLTTEQHPPRGFHACCRALLNASGSGLRVPA
jgi:hypothetical protein